MGQMTMCNMKGVTQSDGLTEDDHTTQFPSVSLPLSGHCFGFPAGRFTAPVALVLRLA